MRLIHTADVHLDMCFAGSGMPVGSGNRRRQSLKDVFQAIVRRANTWPADALLIAGDLFEDDRVTGDTVAFLCAQFESIPEIPVFIAPGNHDPYVRESPYATESWPDNVTIFSKPDWVSHALLDGRLYVHGFGFDGRQPSQNPFGSLRIEPSVRDAVHVAVAHGSERSHQPADKEDYAPFDARDAVPEGLDYLALGHFHSVTEIPGDYRAKVYYSGSPEGHSLREAGMHHYLEIELDQESIRVTPVRSSRIVYTNRLVTCEEFDSSQDAIDAIRAIALSEQGRQIARITLAGNCEQPVRDAFPAVFDAVSPDFEYLDLVDKTAAVEDYEAVAREDTSLGAFVRGLNEEIHDATDEARRELLTRAREVGVAAFRMRTVDVQGLERG